jgi:hypothetical protein
MQSKPQKQTPNDVLQLNAFILNLFTERPDPTNWCCNDRPTLMNDILNMYNKQKCVNFYFDKNVLMDKRVAIKKYSFFSIKQLLRYLIVVLIGIMFVCFVNKSGLFI